MFKNVKKVTKNVKTFFYIYGARVTA